MSGKRCQVASLDRMTRLIHLNGPPGIGKSTIAHRYAANHPGVLNLDIDVLRTLVGGWQEDFDLAGRLVRTAALAMCTAYLRGGHDVVVPQLLADPTQVARFEAAARQAGAAFVERVLMDDRARAASRFNRRGSAEPDGADWHDQVRSIVTNSGGEELLLRYYDSLAAVVAEWPDAVVVSSIEGEIDATYAAVLAALV